MISLVQRKRKQRIDPEFEEYVKHLQKQLKDMFGKDVSFPETTKFIAKINQRHVIVVPRKKRRKRGRFDDVVPFTDI